MMIKFLRKNQTYKPMNIFPKTNPIKILLAPNQHLEPNTFNLDNKKRSVLPIILVRKIFY